MPRSALLAIAALACAALVLPATVTAKSASKTCTVASSKVAGGKVKGTLTSSNVDPSQARFATCAQAKRVMTKVTSIGLEQPRGNVGGFYCKPTVFSTEPDFVGYVCTFKGADTATFVKLVFGVLYKS